MDRLQQYIPPNLRQPLREVRGLGYSLLDNVVGLDDGFESAGERLGTAIRQDPAGMVRSMGGGLLSGAYNAVTSPIDTARGVVSDVAGSFSRAARGADSYLPEGVSLSAATDDQIRAANDAYLADMTGVASVVPVAGPAIRGAGTLARTAANANYGNLAADAIGAARAVGSGDLGLLGEIMQREGTAQSLSAARGPNKAELDPLGYQKTKMRGYLSDVDVNFTDTGENLPRIPMSWEQMEGKVILPFYGDRTSRGLLVTGLSNQRFDQPVYTEGGLDFMRGPAAQADNAIWASNQNIIKRIEKEAEKASRQFEGADIVGMTGTMAPDANDFATMTGAAMAELMKGAAVTKKSAKEFDSIMKTIDPDFVGVLSPNLRDWAVTTSSPKRKSFIRLMDSSPMQEKGFPSPAEARYAVTDPTQADLGAGMFGLGAARIDTSAPLLYNVPKGNLPRASVPHSTYNTQISGEYLGSLPPVPQRLIFKDVYDAMEGKTTKKGQPLNEAHKTHAIKTKMPAAPITPEVLEGILNYVSRQPR